MSGTEIKTGRELDAETGLFYYRARYFSPDLGRFLSRDPLGFDAGDFNLFRYCNNRPTNAVDPTGEWWSLAVTAFFTAADTYQVLTGRISKTEYAVRMAINAASAAADVMTMGMGGGVALRAGTLAARAANAIAASQRAARATSIALVGVRNTERIAAGARYAIAGLNAHNVVSGIGQTAVGVSTLVTTIWGGEECDTEAADVIFTGIDTFRAGYGAFQAGRSLINSPIVNDLLGRNQVSPTNFFGLARPGLRGGVARPQGTMNYSSFIGGRAYTGHALDQMANRGLVPSVVQSAIENGVQEISDLGRTTFTTSEVRVVMDWSGTVVTVMRQ